MKTTKRKTRSDKFPLTLHPTGQYCKKYQRKNVLLWNRQEASARKISGSSNIYTWRLKLNTESIQWSYDLERTVRPLLTVSTLKSPGKRPYPKTP